MRGASARHATASIAAVAAGLGAVAIAGDTDTSLHFHGLRSGMSLGRRFDFGGPQPYTLEIWARVTLSDTSYRHFFKKSAGDAAARQAYGLFVRDDNLTTERIVNGVHVATSTPVSAIKDHWAHVVSSFDGAMLNLFVDGALASSAPDARPASPSTRTSSSAAMMASTTRSSSATSMRSRSTTRLSARIA